MTSESELTRLLRAAETAGPTPPVPADLLAQIHARRKVRDRRTWRIRLGALSVMVVLVIGVAMHSAWQPPVLPKGVDPVDSQLAVRPGGEPGATLTIDHANRLAAEAAALKTEGD